MSVELQDFYTEFFQDVQASADVDATWAEDSFFERFCEHLIAAGELDAADRVAYAPARGGVRVDGYGGDPLDCDGVLSLIVVDFSQTSTIETLTATEMEAMFKRVENFLVRALDQRFRHGLEETSPAFGLADLIAQRWSGLSKVRMFLISNRVLSSRVDGKDGASVGSVPVTYSVWDIGRLHRFAGSGGREEIVVNLEDDFGGALSVLPANMNDAGYQAFLAVVPGAQLAAVYERWGARLLEQNVRVFLQAKGGVNKGIRNTIENDPEMFFAYNNGITATAEGVDTRRDSDGLVVRSVRNLQIVNGGQTTASIHAASRRKDVDLSKIFVQMKLSIIEPSRALAVVPKISEYANSQNRVNAADFFANHPFHVRFEEFSRRLFAPSPDGSFRESKWFYERARGQYQDARAMLSVTGRKKFDLEFPKAQCIEKEDLAKFVNSWRGNPDIVSKGRQKNFAEFARAIGAEWSRDSDTFNEAFFRQSIAQAIVFRAAEKLVTKQAWYEGAGLRSRVVPYAIAKMVHDAAERKRFIDLDAVWRLQGLPDGLTKALEIATAAVNGVIIGSDARVANPLEWAKQQACWNRVKALAVQWPSGWFESLLTGEEQSGARKSAAKEQRILNGIEAQSAVVGAGNDFWRQAKQWGETKGTLSPTDSSIIAVAATAGKLPSEKQAVRALEALRRLQEEGFPGKLEPR